MATNIDKALYQQPMGIDAAAENEEPIEIEIIDPEAVNIKMDGLELSIEKGEPSIDDFDANLADYLPEGSIQLMVSDLDSDIDNDRNSRKEWEKAYVTGLKLLGLQIEERTEPWDGASGVFHPMITEAVVRFQSETITETFPAAGPVRTKIVGKETPAKKEAAQRVQEDMNFQLTEVMQEFRPEHERMLWSLPATGSAFKKVYFDPSIGRQTSIFIPAEDILLPYGTSDIQSCYRVTHVMRKTKNEILELQQAGFYCDVELGTPDRAIDEINKAKDKETGFADLNDERFTLYESHVKLVFKDDPLADKDDDGELTGVALPYVVTFIRGTNTVLAIRRNWNESDNLHLKRQHFVHYQYIPGFGAYGFGLFHLIGGFANSATSLMRQLIDAGTLSNLPGGLKSRGLRIKGDDTPIAPGEFRDVDVGSGTIRDNILPLPYKEPSQVLMTLLGNIVEEGRRFAASVHFTLKTELQLLAAIIRDDTDDEYTYEPDGEEGPRAKKSDYRNVDILPVSDPNAATLSQRVVQYQAVIQLAQMAPQIYNLPLLHRQMLDVLGIKDASKLVPVEDDQKPVDPVQENMNLINGKPVKAFIEQDHQAHIAVHMAAMQDPKMAALIGQNPMAQQIQAAAMAHINEHMAFEYRKQIEQQLGVLLPNEEENANMDPEVAAKVAQMAAQAANRLLQKNQAESAQQQAQQQAQDPVVQMQQKELELKEREVAIKEGGLQLNQQKLAVDAADKADKTELAEKKLAIDALDKADKTDIAEFMAMRNTSKGNQ